MVYTLSPATPELPVRDLRTSLAHYRDPLGFEVAWVNEGGRIAGITHGACTIFLREIDDPVTPMTLWIFAEDLDAVHAGMVAAGAEIAEPLGERPWGLRQFSVRDRDGHILHIHHDL